MGTNSAALYKVDDATIGRFQNFGDGDKVLVLDAAVSYTPSRASSLKYKIKREDSIYTVPCVLIKFLRDFA